jgi:hypothetical protein
MGKTNTVDDFKRYLKENREKVLEHTVRIEDLPADDEWLQDDEWDEIYKREVIEKHGNGRL